MKKRFTILLFVALFVFSLAACHKSTYLTGFEFTEKMDELGFGNCTNTRACEMECPKHITIDHIARLNREYIKAKFSE